MGTAHREHGLASRNDGGPRSPPRASAT